MSPGCEVSVVRGGLVESVHEVAVVAVAAGGAVVAETPGAAALPVFLRSAAKPFQAEPAVRAGVLERLGLDDRHLALACASHLGRGPARRARGRDPRRRPASAGARCECGRDDRPSPLHHMCSGNHALGLALCVCEGWPTAGYLEPGHPLQVAMRAAVATAGRRGAGGGRRRLRHARLPAAAAPVRRALFGAPRVGRPARSAAAPPRCARTPSWCAARARSTPS